MTNNEKANLIVDSLVSKANIFRSRIHEMKRLLSAGDKSQTNNIETAITQEIEILNILDELIDYASLKLTDDLLTEEHVNELQSV